MFAYARPGSSASDRSPGASRLANGNSSILGAGLCVRSSFELCSPLLVSERSPSPADPRLSAADKNSPMIDLDVALEQVNYWAYWAVSSLASQY